MTVAQAQAKQIFQLQALWKEAFEDSDSFLHTFFQTAFSPARCCVVTENDNVLAALYWFDCLYQERPMAYLYAIATKKSHRGRGLCRQLMEDTHRHLAALGYCGALLVPASPSLFGYYQKLGYQTATHVQQFPCAAGEEPIDLIPLSALEFAQKRRLLLPFGGVIQENESLDLLQAYSTFYAARDALCVFSEQDGQPVILELLGDPAIAPRILKALGYASGTVRTPGNGQPFSMFLPLAHPNLPPPSYFGLAFD